jgi:uncharacterized membrane protein
MLGAGQLSPARGHTVGDEFDLTKVEMAQQWLFPGLVLVGPMPYLWAASRPTYLNTVFPILPARAVREQKGGHNG